MELTMAIFTLQRISSLLRLLFYENLLKSL